MRVPVVLLVSALTAGASLDAQVTLTPLVVLATVGDYPGETYTAGPIAPAEFVFFENEPVAVDVSVANWGSSSAPVRLPSSTSSPMVQAVVWKGDQAVSSGRLLEPMWRETVAGSQRVTPSATMVIEPGDALRWRLMVDTGTLGPGFYLVRVQTVATGGAGESIRTRRSEFIFEMRARSEALPAELSRRAAEWLTAEGDAGRARAATDDLERVYPDSVAVHLIRSRIAEAEGNDSLARLELDRAAEFMRSDRDTLFRHFARPGQIEDLIDSLAR